MFGNGEQQSSANARLREARDRAYGVLQAAVAATSPGGLRIPSFSTLWALVHGIATLILERCIKPADYGLKVGKP